MVYANFVKNERGSQTLEFIAIFPLIIFSFLLIWQMALVAYSVVVAEAAARDGARVAAVVGESNMEPIRDAVHRAAYGLEVNSVTASKNSTSYGEEITVTIEVEMMTINIPFINDLSYTINADSTMPYEE